jgi:uncharacterized protein (TIGR02646 family)
MRHIVKNPRNEPKSLVRFRSMQGASYSSYGDRDTITGEERPLKKALAKEQKFICCYCMRRIEFAAMTVEHYISQNHHSSSPLQPEEHAEKTLDYGNMLGCCNSKVRNCSGIRGNLWITVDPREKMVEQLVKFDKEGRAFSKNATIQNEIQNILKLNEIELLENRLVAINLAKERLVRHYPEGSWTKTMIQREITYWLSPYLGKNGVPVYREYCMAAVHYLRSKIQKAQ